MQDRHLCSPPLLFSWPRSGTPTLFILESPLTGEPFSTFCWAVQHLLLWAVLAALVAWNQTWASCNNYIETLII